MDTHEVAASVIGVMTSAPGRGCSNELGRELGKPNARVYNTTPSAVDVETILVSTVTGRTVGVSVESHEYKNRIPQDFDFEGLVRVQTR